MALDGAASTVKDVTTASFKADVINASLKGPVLVDFWAPWCGPCKQLAPVLEKAVADSNGKVTLVKMNIDEHPQIPGQLGIQSIPAVIAFERGQPIDGLRGALPESQVRGFIERLVGPLTGGSDTLIAEAEAKAAAGDVDGAAELYAHVLAEDETNLKAIGGLAKLHVEAGNLEEARAVLSMAPPPARNMCRISYFMHRNTPSRSTAMISSKALSGMSASGRVAGRMPALLNAQCRPPCRVTAASTSAATCSARRTSVRW